MHDCIRACNAAAFFYVRWSRSAHIYLRTAAPAGVAEAAPPRLASCRSVRSGLHLAMLPAVQPPCGMMQAMTNISEWLCDASSCWLC